MSLKEAKLSRLADKIKSEVVEVKEKKVSRVAKVIRKVKSK
jgi:hypothetical protein